MLWTHLLTLSAPNIIARLAKLSAASPVIDRPFRFHADALPSHIQDSQYCT